MLCCCNSGDDLRASQITPCACWWLWLLWWSWLKCLHVSEHLRGMFSYQCMIIQIFAPSDRKNRRGSSQRHHGARLKVKVYQSVCNGADAAGGGACSHLALLKALEVTLKQEEETLLLHRPSTVILCDEVICQAIRGNWEHWLSWLHSSLNDSFESQPLTGARTSPA